MEEEDGQEHGGSSQQEDDDPWPELGFNRGGLDPGGGGGDGGGGYGVGEEGSGNQFPVIFGEESCGLSVEGRKGAYRGKKEMVTAIWGGIKENWVEPNTQSKPKSDPPNKKRFITLIFDPGRPRAGWSWSSTQQYSSQAQFPAPCTPKLASQRLQLNQFRCGQLQSTSLPSGGASHHWHPP